jgi:hypothetical protein
MTALLILEVLELLVKEMQAVTVGVIFLDLPGLPVAVEAVPVRSAQTEQTVKAATAVLVLHRP